MSCSPSSNRRFPAILAAALCLAARSVAADPGEVEIVELLVAAPPMRAAVEIVYVGELPAPELKTATMPAKSASLPEPQPKAKAPAAAAKPASPAPAKSAAQATQPATQTKPATPATPAKGAEAAKPAPKAEAAKQAEPKPANAETAKPAAPERKPVETPSVPPSKTPVTAPANAAPIPQTWKDVNAILRERFEILIPGSSWTYLGDIYGREGLRHDSRRFEGANAVFAFVPERVGEYYLRFKRQDPVRGVNEDRVVKVTVAVDAAAFAAPEAKDSGASAAVSGNAKPAAGSAAPASSPSAEGQSKPSAATPSASASSAAAAASTPGTASPAAGTPAPSAAGVPGAAPSQSAAPADSQAAVKPEDVPSAPDTLVAYARDELAAKRPHNAIAVLDRYLALYPAGSDEVFMLLGKAYETDGPYRDIRKAHANYKRVRDEYPRSKFWKEASERVAYIERRYFDIR